MPNANKVLAKTKTRTINLGIYKFIGGVTIHSRTVCVLRTDFIFFHKYNILSFVFKADLMRHYIPV